MISMQELLQENKMEDLSEEFRNNLTTLHERMNKVRTLYNKPMSVTSCIRTMADQLRIYKEKGITDPAKIPMKSKHLFCQAVDIRDSEGDLYCWCETHENDLLDIGLWLEAGTKGWVHFQIVQYGSWTKGKTIFFQP